MTMISAAQTQIRDGYFQLVRELQAQFDCSDVTAVADRIVESEAADFYWEARVDERYLGQYPDIEAAGEEPQHELVRVACLSRFAQRWHVGTFLVNGEGQPCDLLWKRSFDDRAEADVEFRSAR